MSTAWEAILPEIAYCVFEGQGPIKTTATSGSTLTWADSSFTTSSTESANRFDGCSLYVLDTTDDAAPEGSFRRIDSWSGNTGTWTFGSAITTVTAGDIGLIFYRFTPDEFLRAANHVIGGQYWPRYVAASLLTDGDMETSGTTNWADVTGTPTQTKITSGNVLTGTQALHVIYTVVDTSVGQSLAVQPQEQLSVSATGILTAGSWCLQAYDVTNSAVIYTSGTLTGNDSWQTAWFQCTVPPGCYSVSFRIINKTAATTVDIDHVSVLSDKQAFPRIPSQITDASLIEELMLVDLDQGNNVADGYFWSGKFQCWTRPDTLKDYVGVVPNRVNMRMSYLPQGPLFWKFRAAEAELTGLTSTVSCTAECVDAIVYGTAGELLERWASQLRGENAQMKARQAAKWRNRYQAVLESLDLGRPTTKGGLFVARIP